MKQLEFTRSANVRYSADVTVIGGGVAGCAAAISAARGGVKTLLIEKSGCLGGMATMGHVSPLDAVGTRGGKHFGGLVDEIVLRTEKMNIRYGGADFKPRFGPEILRIVLLQMAMESNVKILFHADFLGVNRNGNTITAAFVHTKSGVEAVESKIFIDATGDGDLIAESGEEYVLGSEPGVFAELAAGGMDKVHFETGTTENYAAYEHSGLMQPVSMMFTMGNVDFSRCSDLSNRLLTFEDLKIDKEEFFNLPYAGTVGFEENGDYVPMPQGRILICRAAKENQVLVNMGRVIGVNSTDAVELSRAEETAQLQMLYLVDFLIRYIPGFENSYLLNSSHTLGIRESRRLVGRYVLKGREAIECAAFEDVVAQGSYMIDIHDPQGKRKAIGGELKKDCYSIPYRCLLPKSVSNLLVCGRCISVDHVAHASTRIQGTCILTGQAAGTAAWNSVKTGKAIHDLNTVEIRNELEKSGVNFY